jgi:dGTPase
LDASTKYPWPAAGGNRKFGVYNDDVVIFDWMRAGAVAGRRCQEAQVMDWADDVAYSVHDVEDAVVLQHVDLGALRSPSEQGDVAATARRLYAQDFDQEALVEALRRLVGLPVWPHDFDGSHRALANLKAMTSTLIGRFSLSAQAATIERYGAGPLRRYTADLIVPADVRAEVAVMKGVTAHYVMYRPDALAIYDRQRSVIGDVAAALLRRDGRDLDPWLMEAWDEAPDDAARLRVVVDQVASLTDVSILRWHARLCR